jgi:hypothetical protein
MGLFGICAIEVFIYIINAAERPGVASKDSV